MPFIGQITGKQYETFEAMLHEERKEAMRRANRDERKREMEFADIPQEKLRAICEAAQLETEGRFEDRAASNYDVTVWLKLHPEYINNDHNKKQMLHQIGHANPNIQELEAAYQDLRPADLLQLDQAVVAKQADQAATNAAKGIAKAGGPLPIYTEEQLEAMPLDDLRALCNSGFVR